MHTPTDHIAEPRLTQREFYLSLAELALLDTSGCRLRYLTLDSGSPRARVGLQWSGAPLNVPATGIGGAFSAEPQAPGAVGSDRWCLTLVAGQLQLQQLLQLLAFFSAEQWPLVAADTLARSDRRTVIRFQFGAGPRVPAQAGSACIAQAGRLGVDLIPQSGDSQRVPKLACFDMDSTLIEAEVIDELAKVHGVGAEVAEITAAAMAGELDFKQSFRRRMQLLQGLHEARLAAVAKALPVTAGAGRLLRALRALGCKNAIISGGFSYFARFLQTDKLAVDLIFANQLDFCDGRLTGRVVEPIVDAAHKARQLRETAMALGLPLQQVIAVGDGANDLPMLSLGALGIAYRAKPRVRVAAPQVIDHGALDTVLYLFGLNDRQLAALLD